MKHYLKVLLGLVARSLFLRIQYRRAQGHWPDVKNPRSLSEIIFVLKLKSDSSLAMFCDKILVREYVKSKIVNQSLSLKIPKISYETDYLTYDTLPMNHPEGFLKLNNGSGYTLFLQANSFSKLTRKELKMINRWRNRYYHLASGENGYAKIRERIYFEEALRTKNGDLPNDIKVHCFNGTPYIYQTIRRTSGKLERQTFDKDWQKKNIFQNEVLDVSVSQNLREKIRKSSEALSKGFRYVRVDFYLVDEEIYFSELTFFPNSSHLRVASREIDLFYGKEFLESNAASS